VVGDGKDYRFSAAINHNLSRRDFYVTQFYFFVNDCVSNKMLHSPAKEEFNSAGGNL
jgi:hypothetical protein